jgi:hypothetical protein
MARISRVLGLSALFLFNVGAQASTVLSSTVTLSAMGITVDSLDPGVPLIGAGFSIGQEAISDPETMPIGLRAEVQKLQEGEIAQLPAVISAPVSSAFWPIWTADISTADSVARSLITRQLIQTSIAMSDEQLLGVFNGASDSINVTQYAAIAGLPDNENFLITIAPRTKVSFNAMLNIDVVMDGVAISQVLNASSSAGGAVIMSVAGGTMFIGDTTTSPGVGQDMILGMDGLNTIADVWHLTPEARQLNFVMVNEGDEALTLPFTYRLIADTYISVMPTFGAAVPEPSACALMVLGLVGVAAAKRRSQAA